jgi:hypothetical protein
MTWIALAWLWPNHGSAGARPISCVATAAVGLLASAHIASASLIGAQVSYQYLFPTQKSLDGTLPAQTVTPLTTFADTINGLTSFFLGNQLVVENTSPAAFATAPFNGPQFTFADGGLTGATVDPTSSTDFGGVVAATGNSVQTNYSALTPALGSTQTIDLASSFALAGHPVGYNYLLPTTTSVQEVLGSTTLTKGTYFVDKAQGITVAIGASTITVINDEAAGFINSAFNGPDLVFTGVNILGASIDPISATDFLGSVTTTPNSIAINFANLNPGLGHAEVIDIQSVPEPGSFVLLSAAIAGLAWMRRRPARHHDACLSR